MVVIARIKAQPGKEKEMEKVFLDILPKVEAEEGTLEYRLNQSQMDPTRFVFIETYTGKEALAAHGSSDAFKAMFAAIAPMLDGDPEITILKEIGRIKR